MTTKQLFSKFEHLEQNLRHNQYLLDAVQSMSRRQNEITNLHSRSLVVDPGGETINAVNQTRQKLREIIQENKRFSPIRILKEIENLLVAFAEAETGLDSETNSRLNVVKTELEAFRGAYEKFILDQQLGETAQLLSVAQRVDVAINSSIMFASVVIKNLCPEAGTERTDDQIEIYLSSETDFLSFLEKINALEQIYEEFCHLFNVSAKQEPLKIVKIESGTAWAWLTGNIAIITAMRNSIEKAAHFLYRNYTTEGKISTIPDKIEKIEEALHLSDELKKRGIETEKLNDHLAKASIKVGQQLEKLLGGEEQVELNGEVIALTPQSQQKLITKKQVRLIEDKPA